MYSRRKIPWLMPVLFVMVHVFPPVTIAEDEPAPVIYIDPETGELSVQNPPRLSREHAATAPVAPAAGIGDGETSSDSPARWPLLFVGILAALSLVAALSHVLLRRKKSSPRPGH